VPVTQFFPVPIHCIKNAADHTLTVFLEVNACQWFTTTITQQRDLMPAFKDKIPRAVPHHDVGDFFTANAVIEKLENTLRLPVDIYDWKAVLATFADLYGLYEFHI
jgi:hypothetical protein